MASHLSEPLLKEILKTLQTLPNEKEQVQLFVSLASYLPDSLIHDALTAIQSIEYENSRTIALVALIPRLPDFLLDTALVMANNIQEEENREKILVKLVAQVPQLRQHDLLEETIETLTIRCQKQWERERENPNQEETRIKNVDELQVDAMLKLALSIPEYFKEIILSRAINIAKNIQNDVGKKVAIRQLIPHLLNSQLDELLPIVRELEDENLLADVIIKLAPHAPDYLLQEGLEAAQKIIEKTKKVEIQIGNLESSANQQQAEIFAKLAPYLKNKDSLLEKAIISARKIKNSHFKINAVAALACHLPKSQRDLVFKQEVFEATKNEIKRFNEQGYFAKKVFKTIAPYLSDKLEDVLRKTLIIASQTDDNTRKSLLELLGVYLSQLSSASIFPLWCDTLHILARRTRKDLLSDLSALTPVIKSLGGTQAIEETAYAIQDVGRWWS